MIARNAPRAAARTRPPQSMAAEAVIPSLLKSEMGPQWSVDGLGSWRGGLESDLVPEMFQAPDQAFLQHFAVLLIKEVRAEVMVADLAS